MELPQLNVNKYKSEKEILVSNALMEQLSMLQIQSSVFWTLESLNQFTVKKVPFG